ncbi:MAG TPA: hypothetical protein PLG09_05930 [Syntrophomonadaceae bacterium]|jgi:transposase-like protein|nr:hypothetical protein [Syntrophomonadaceae bacterium]HOQ09646.1 hypothetical protein [Syntrophomonadaceae bacterium]HPU49167.1 hypothetical protein [Syntrophomonadaceae bacterium]
MRLSETAQLMIYCPRCGNYVNEYNWTLETASKFSENGKSTPTLIYVLLQLADHPQQWENFKVVCPRCHETMPVKILPPMDRQQLEAYAREVGEAYVNFQY